MKRVVGFSGEVAGKVKQPKKGKDKKLGMPKKVAENEEKEERESSKKGIGRRVAKQMRDHML